MTSRKRKTTAAPVRVAYLIDSESLDIRRVEVVGETAHFADIRQGGRKARVAKAGLHASWQEARIALVVAAERSEREARATYAAASEALAAARAIPAFEPGTGTGSAPSDRRPGRTVDGGSGGA